MAARQLSQGDGDGTLLGQDSTDPIGFYGATPVARPATAGGSTVASTAITTLATTPTATDIAIAVNSLIARVEAIRVALTVSPTALVTLGLVAS